MSSDSDADRVDSGDLARWQDFVLDLERRPGMFLVEGAFAEVCAAMLGFHLGIQRTGFLPAFHAWLIQRNPLKGNHIWWALVLDEALGDRPPYEDLDAGQLEAARLELFELLRQFMDSLRSEA